MLNNEIHSIIYYYLKNIENPVIFELGSNIGMDTIILSRIKNSIIHAFEPNEMCDIPNLENVILNRVGVCNNVGESEFFLSDKWTYSSSLLKPKNHYIMYPNIKFDKKIKIKTTTIDNYCKENNINHIDFLWMDVEGAEHLVFDGASQMLDNIKYIYTEYSNNEKFEGQKTLTELSKILKNFKILKVWQNEPSNVLFKNNII